MLQDLKNMIFSIKKIEKELGVNLIVESNFQEQINRINQFSEIMEEIQERFESKNLKDVCQVADYLFFTRSKIMRRGIKSMISKTFNLGLKTIDRGASLISCEVRFQDMIELVEDVISKIDFSKCD